MYALMCPAIRQMVRHALRRLLMAVVVAGLPACSTLPEPEPAPDNTCAPAATHAANPARPSAATTSPPIPLRTPQHIDLQGQLSIKLGAFADQAAKGMSLGFFFSGNTQAGQLELMTLMGSQVAQVRWQADQVWLSNDKGTQPYNSLDELSEATLGEPLPLRTLIHWMQGHPDPDRPHQVAQAPDTFTQDGWLVDAHDLPAHKLQAQRPAGTDQRSVLIKVYLDR
jgi:outer membrane biogenesis lipoprotein LolB